MPDGDLGSLAQASYDLELPENRAAQSGDRVQIVMLEVEGRRPVEDILWTDEDYREVYGHAGLVVIATHRPLAKQSEPYAWVSETTIAPWAIYMLETVRMPLMKRSANAKCFDNILKLRPNRKLNIVK